MQLIPTTVTFNCDKNGENNAQNVHRKQAQNTKITRPYVCCWQTIEQPLSDLFEYMIEIIVRALISQCCMCVNFKRMRLQLLQQQRQCSQVIYVNKSFHSHTTHTHTRTKRMHAHWALRTAQATDPNGTFPMIHLVCFDF